MLSSEILSVTIRGTPFIMEFALGKGLYDDAEHRAQDQVLTDLFTCCI